MALDLRETSIVIHPKMIVIMIHTWMAMTRMFLELTVVVSFPGVGNSRLMYGQETYQITLNI